MSSVLTGFGVIIVVVAVGFLVARIDLLGTGARLSLNRLVFFVATPALLFDALARTTLDQVFNMIFLVCAVSALGIAVLYVAVARLWLRSPAGDLAIGAMAAGYVNSANLGIPIAMYVIGDLGFVFPLLLFQVVVLQPLAIATLEREAATSSVGPGQSTGGVLLTTVRNAMSNPLILAALLGIVVAAIPWQPADQILEPIRLIGQISVPGALLLFGMSLVGVRVLERGSSPRRQIALVSVLKLIIHPLGAFALGSALGLTGHELFTVVVACALPTAQNVLVVATQYDRGILLARDSAVLTTLGSIPVLLFATALLAG